MLLPTDEETVQGVKQACKEVSHPCFPCIFAKVMQYASIETPSGSQDISQEVFNECAINPSSLNVKERCNGFYCNGISKEKERC